MPTFTWDGTVLDLAGNNAANGISGNLEQSGSILRTITGLGVANRIWSKWVYSFSWNQAPDEVADKLEAMKAHDGIIAFADSTIGSYSFNLTDDDLTVGRTAFGIANASAVFREQ